MNKKIRFLILVVVVIIIVVSCTTFAAVKKPIKLVYGTTNAQGEIFYKADLYFKELVEKNSKGQIIIEYYNASQLGSLTEMTQATKVGSQQMVGGNFGALFTYWSRLGTFDLPYLYRDQDHFFKVASKINSFLDQDEMAAKTGMHILSARVRLPRQLTSKIPVNKLEDLKGMKIRVPQISSWLALWKALGAAPTVLPWADTLTSLATGVVDAQENPMDGIFINKVYEYTKYCALTYHIRDMVLVLINDKVWKSLTKAQRKIIQDAAKKSENYVKKDIVKSEKEYYQSLVKVGMVFTNPDLVPIREKAKTIWSQFGDAGLIKKIEAVK
jgi:tripartite ATP-independent transporter DctP family solute receptor